MHGFDTYDYGARGYYPASGRFMTVDPLAEKYYSISPYVYCGNNPVNNIDFNGDSITYKSDDSKQIEATQNLINDGIGKNVAEINKSTGLLSVGKLSDEEYNNLSDEQKNFYSVMSDIANGAGMTNIDVVSGSEAVFVGSYETGKIDIKDMNDIGTGEGVDKYSTFSHEMAEQRYKQSNPNSTSYTMAHNTAGIPAEEKVAGYKRTDMPSSSPNQINVKFSYYSPDYTTNKFVNVHIEINKNNVIKIERK